MPVLDLAYSCSLTMVHAWQDTHGATYGGNRDVLEGQKMKKYRVAILGSGNIGTDLLEKVIRSSYLEAVAFVGRSYASQGMIKARSLGIPCSDQSIRYFEDMPTPIDLVFDATSAKDHTLHAPTFKRLGIRAIDLTPAKIGPMCVPAVNKQGCLGEMNINMVTCGGQASIPIAYAIGQTQKDLEYVEVVSSIASKTRPIFPEPR